MSLSKFLRTGDSHFAEIKSHAFWALLILGGATLIQFAFDFFLARSYGAYGSGIFYLSFNIALTLALIGRLGFDRAVIRFIPPLMRRQSNEEARGVSSSAVKMSLLLTVPTGIALFFLAPWLAAEVFNEPSMDLYLRTLSFSIPFLSLTYIYAGVLKAIKKTQISLVVERVAIYAIGILLILTVGRIYGLDALIIGFTIATVVVALLGAWFIRRYIPIHTPIIPFGRRKLLRSAAPMLFVLTASQMNGQIGILLLGIFSDSSAVGVFNISLKISLLMTLILTAINTIAATKISELHTSSKKDELKAVVGKITTLSAAVALPVFLVIFLFPAFLLGLFGPDFVAGSTGLRILVIGQLINVVIGSGIYILAMIGKERMLAAAVGASLSVNLTLGFILIPLYGTVGAAITTASAITVSCLIMVSLVRRYVGVWQIPFRTWPQSLRNSAQQNKGDSS